MTFPFVTSPGGSMSRISESAVTLLPQPDSPTIPKTLPSSIEKETPLTARMMSFPSLNWVCRFSTSSKVLDIRIHVKSKRVKGGIISYFCLLLLNRAIGQHRCGYTSENAKYLNSGKPHCRFCPVRIPSSMDTKLDVSPYELRISRRHLQPKYALPVGKDLYDFDH